MASRGRSGARAVWYHGTKTDLVLSREVDRVKQRLYRLGAGNEQVAVVCPFCFRGEASKRFDEHNGYVDAARQTRFAGRRLVR
jgi:hypothetical protein